MGTAVDFYFDFSSPYSYFASTRIESLAKELGREVNWHPILLGPMFKLMGSAPLMQVPLKGAYAEKDFARTAQLFNIPFELPKPFPIASVAAARASLYLLQHRPDTARLLIHRLFKAYYVDGLDISQQDKVLAVAADIGLDGNQLAAVLADDQLKAALKDAVAAALARGVFGAPFIIIDDEPFWGFDRFEHIRMWAALK